MIKVSSTLTPNFNTLSILLSIINFNARAELERLHLEKNWTCLNYKARRKLCAGKKRDRFESFAHLRLENNSQMVHILYSNAVQSPTHHQVLLSVRPNVLLSHSALRSVFMNVMNETTSTYRFFVFTCRTHTCGYNSLGFREAQFILTTHDFSCPVKHFISSAHFIWNH